MPVTTHTHDSPKATIILQGRVASTRLPGKVLLPLAGKATIQHVYERMLQCRNVDRIIIATSVNPEDNPIEQMFQQQGVTVFRGSADDPLDRYYQAASHFGVKHVMRVMSDCPLVDPQLSDAVITGYFEGDYDYYSLGKELPPGLGAGVISFSALERTWRETSLRSDREHITPYISNHPEIFKLGSLDIIHGLQHHRWVMDHPEDYQFMQAIYAALYQPGKLFLTDDIITFLHQHPHLLRLNNHIPKEEAYNRLVALEKASGVAR